MLSKKQFFTATAGMMALGALAVADNAQAGDKADKEKCFGVVKAGANDCGAPGHSCAGHAATDSDPHEWVFVPKGLCERLTGGSLDKPTS